jgi:hypothetical protein
MGSDLETDNETRFAARQQIFSKYKRPLLGNAFANNHVPTEIGATEELCFLRGPCEVISKTRFRASSVESQSVKRRLRAGVRWLPAWELSLEAHRKRELCERVCDEQTHLVSAVSTEAEESPPLKSVIRKRLRRLYVCYSL